MAKQKKDKHATTVDSTATVDNEGKLWQMADALRGTMDSAEYKHVVLGLIFLKYISDAFEELHSKLTATVNQGADPEDPDEYRGAAHPVFWVPIEARWPFLRGKARLPTIGQLVDEAMAGLERDNPALKGVLPKDYARAGLDKIRLGQLIDKISNISVGSEDARARDVLGGVYEYFLSQFASAEGKKGGEFYTPRSVVRLLVEMLEPYHGRVYDPCCGSAGMFVQSVEFIRAHAHGNGNGGKAKGDISIYGQESNYTTWRLAKMNLAIRGIDGQIAYGDTFLVDRHPDLRADFILANPPFNVSDWGGDALRDDKRWLYGPPPGGNANFAWVEHIVYHLAPAGVAGFVLGNNSLTSEVGGEDEIRKNIVDDDIVDCIVMLPDRLFYSTPIPASLWILRRGRTHAESVKGSPQEVLFIDASKLGVAITRTHRELTADNVSLIARTYRNWRSARESYNDEEGFCRSAQIEEVRMNHYNLLPAAYVNRGHLHMAGGPQLHDLARSVDAAEANRHLESVGDLSNAFSESRRMVESQVDLLERDVSFETLTLADILERSDERLGQDEEPEVLTCTESGGLILQRERFAKRVATSDASRYKVVHMGDIVYNPYLLWKGSIDQCWIVEVGITSPVYEVLRVKPGFDPTIVGQLVTSKEMVRRYDGISFGTIQRRRRAPVEKFLEMQVNFPVGATLASVSVLLNIAQDAQFASRNAERALKRYIRAICENLR